MAFFVKDCEKKKQCLAASGVRQVRALSGAPENGRMAASVTKSW